MTRVNGGLLWSYNISINVTPAKIRFQTSKNTGRSDYYDKTMYLHTIIKLLH